MVNWQEIGLVPCSFKENGNLLDRSTFRVRLPLVGDGRIAIAQLRSAPDRAEVVRHAAREDDRHGCVWLINNQWSIVWLKSEPHRLPTVRFSAPRFLQGDMVCLRMGTVPISIFKVTDSTNATRLVQKTA